MLSSQIPSRLIPKENMGWDLGSVLADPIPDPPQMWGDGSKGWIPSGIPHQHLEQEFLRIGIGIRVGFSV